MAGQRQVTAPAPGASSPEDAAVTWLARRRAHLDPDLAQPDVRLFARKALAEVALLVGLRSRLDPGPLPGGYRALAGTVREVASRASYRDLVGGDRRALLLYAGTYAALRQCGHEDVDFRHVLEKVVNGRHATAFERAPYRHLDLLHTLELAGIPHRLPGVDQVLPLTLVVANPNVLELSTGDLYAITHATFYASDFGRRDIAWPATTSADDVVAMLEECLLICLARGDADLTGELLISLTCAGAPESEVVLAARGALAGWQEPSGRCAGPPGVVPERLLAADEDWADWATAYHTTVVVALEHLLRRTVGAGRRHPSPRPHRPAAGAGRPVVAAAVRAAAEWLDDPAAPLDARTTVWVTEAWRTAGDDGRARRTLARSAVTPQEALSGDIARRLATLWTWYGAEPAPGAPDRVLAGSGEPPSPAAPGLRARSLEAVSRLLGGDREPRDGTRPAGAVVRLLVAAAKQAVEDGDLGWLAVMTRGLALLPGVPPRLLGDAVDVLTLHQQRDGSFGLPSSDPTGRGRREWTLLALAALVDAGASRYHRSGTP
ncbi:MAG TPA: hypothetical protein VGD67_19735 [Pseudonocardiaceae bacterium]